MNGNGNQIVHFVLTPELFEFFAVGFFLPWPLILMAWGIGLLIGLIARRLRR